MRASTPVAVTLLVAASLGLGAQARPAPKPAPAEKAGKGVIPADRLIVWNPGLNAVGGIPHRTAVYKTLQPNGSDDTEAIQDALNSCPANQVVQLGPGTFRIFGEGLSITRSNVVLRGSGPDKTVLEKHGKDMPVIIIGLRWFKYSSPVDLVADAPKDATSVKLASNPGYTAGEIVILNQLSDDKRSDFIPPVRKVFWGAHAPAGSEVRGWFAEDDRPIGQVLEIASVQGNTVTFTTALHLGFEKALQAHVVRFSNASDGPPVPAVKYSGIEDLAVSNGDGGDGGGNIHFFAAAYCWVKNVESSLSIGHSCNLEGTFRCEVRDSYFHTTRDPNPGGAGYGIGINRYASDNLYENNVVWNFNKLTIARASGGGNVFGYNYFQDGYGAGYPDFVEVGAGPNHYAGAHMELFEGNEGFNFDTESQWGNSTYGMVFRNHWTGLRRSAAPLKLADTSNRRAVGLQTGGWWFSFLGNVLGFPGMPLAAGQSRFLYQADVKHMNVEGTVPMWKLGYDTVTWPEEADPIVVGRTLRHGNYDYVTNSVLWDPTNSVHKLPASLYLKQKPAFFGANPWPWVEASGHADADRLLLLPAKARFDAIHAEGSDGTPGAAPADK